MNILDGIGYVLVIIMLCYLAFGMIDGLRKTVVVMYWTIKLDNEGFAEKERELRAKWDKKPITPLFSKLRGWRK